MGTFGSDSQDTDKNTLPDTLSQYLTYISRASTESTGKPAERIETSAEGNVSVEKINNMDTKHSLQSYLYPNEQPHYIFSHNSRGLKLKPSESLRNKFPQLSPEYTPHNVGYRGGRYLVVTERRLLFIAGWPTDAETESDDKVIEFRYSNIYEVTDSNGGLLSTRKIIFTVANDLTVEFPIDDGEFRKIATDYIEYRLDEICKEQESVGVTEEQESVGVTEEQESVEVTEEQERKNTEGQESGTHNNKLVDIYSDFTEIDSLISNARLQKAAERLSDVESRVDSLEQESSNYDSENIEQFQQLVNEKRQELQQKKNQQKIQSIGSEISEIDSLISDSEFQEAGSQLNDVESQIDTLEQRSFDYKPERVEQLRHSVREKRKELQQKKREEQLKEKIQFIGSDLSKVDSLISDTEFQRAGSQLDDIESQVNELEQNSFNYKSEKVEQLRHSVKEKRKKLQRKKREEQLKEKIQSIGSDLSEIDSLVTDAKYQEAENLVDETKSEISLLKQEISQENLGNLETELRRLEREYDERLSKSHILGQLREMDPYKFEKLVARIWEAQGWDTEVTSGSADRGVDVIATKQDAFENRRHLIQVKRHGESTTVGSEDIQRYASLYQRDEQVDNVFIVTSNRFTSEAKEVAKRRDVSTVNGDGLYKMLTET